MSYNGFLKDKVQKAGDKHQHAAESATKSVSD
jgi:hypothetical protein